MNKKIVAGAVILGVATTIGLTGCGKEVEKYSIIFDANGNGLADSGEKVIEFEKGDKSIDKSKVPSYPEDAETGFAGEWESFELKDEDIVVKAKYGNGSAETPYLVATANQFKRMMNNYDNALNTTYFKLLDDIDVSSLDTTELGATRFMAIIDGDGHTLKGLTADKLLSTNGCLIGESIGVTIKNLNIELTGKAITLINSVGFGKTTLENVVISGSAEVRDEQLAGALFVNSVNPENEDTEVLVLFKNCKSEADLTYYGTQNNEVFNVFVGNISGNAGVSLDTTNQVSKGVSGLHNVQYSVINSVDKSTGFATVWEDVEVDGNSYSKFVKAGDGSEQNPYLVSTTEQFRKILTDYTYDSIDKTDLSKVHFFKLLNDIDMAGINVSGKRFAGGIDGDGYTLLNMDSNLFAENEGAMFSRTQSWVENGETEEQKISHNTVIQNLNIKLGRSIATLVDQAWGTTLYNIIVSNMNGIESTFVNVGDNNESPFICHVMDGTNILENCSNYANFISAADYMGLFVGGYAWDDTTVVFRNCINNGNVRTAGSVGMLFGNGSHRALSITVENCANNGIITSNKESHILISHQKGKFSEDYAMYDNLSTTEIRALDVKGVARISENNIIVTANDEESLPTGEYQLIISALASNDNERTLRTNIVLTKKLTETGDLTFNNALYGMMDGHTYLETYGENALDNADWTDIDGYVGIRYWLDTTNKCYVIDYSGYEELYNLQSNVIRLNTQLGSVEKIIIARQDDGDINFVVDFNG